MVYYNWNPLGNITWDILQVCVKPGLLILITPQPFYTRFQKAFHAVKLLDCCYERELDDDEAKILFFYSFPKEHIQDYVHHGKRDFDIDTLEFLKNFFQGHYDANPPKKNNCTNDHCKW